jgi:hypothetical protein
MGTEDQSVTTAVVTGGHGFDVPRFHHLFRGLTGIDAYIQHLEEWSTCSEQMRDSYDAVLFYFMPTEGPAEGKPPKAALEHLGETMQGIFVLHHAILAYPKWPVWNEIVGIEDRSFGFYDDQHMQIEVADPEHPITRGLTGWEMTDETYTMDDAGPDSEILLTVDHPRSTRTIAWTRQHKRARVFCLELGHDNSAWSNPHFRALVERGIQWVAHRL